MRFYTFMSLLRIEHEWSLQIAEAVAEVPDMTCSVLSIFIIFDFTCDGQRTPAGLVKVEVRRNLSRSELTLKLEFEKE